MIYDTNLGRFLALCRKNNITMEGAHYIAGISGYDLISPEHVAFWDTMFSDHIKAEMRMIPDGMAYEATENEMEHALEACKDNLQDILRFAPMDDVQTEHEATEAPKTISGQQRSESTPNVTQ